MNVFDYLTPKVGQKLYEVAVNNDPWFIQKAFGKNAKISRSNISMRRCQDVPKFLNKLEQIEKRSARSKLQFD